MCRIDIQSVAIPVVDLPPFCSISAYNHISPIAERKPYAMNALAEIKSRFAKSLATLTDNIDPLLEMIRPAQDAKFGDYQVNCAMPLKKQLDQPPREIAARILEGVSLDDFCQEPEIAGPGFINLKLSDNWLQQRLHLALTDARLGIASAEKPKTFVIDFSSPNVAKPMHVGHIRSTVIGNSLARLLRFAGHHVITDNHLGDWGTQFGMIIYGYKHFVDSSAYQDQPIAELSRIYRLVRQLIDYHAGKEGMPARETALSAMQHQLETLASQPPTDNKAEQKKHKKEVQRLKTKIEDEEKNIRSLKTKLAEVDQSESLSQLAQQNADIGSAVLDETVKLHEGDQENLGLWEAFLPHCHEEIQRIYDRLDIQFDHELGESFYHDQLAGVVRSLEEKQMATISDGATCVFLENHDAPMIIRKKDGAFLYATTDLATVEYRVKTWNPDVILYVVDHRQSDHFTKLFDAARQWGYDQVDFVHVSFGTVLGDDGKPFKTRDGDTVGLEGLLDRAEGRALEIVKSQSKNLSPESMEHVATVVGLGALKYADLSQNRSSDYRFSYDKMLALTGNTATYLQYSYARVQGIFTKGNVDVEALRENPSPFALDSELERQLAVSLIRLGEAIDEALVDYKPNLLANYLFETTQTFFTFYNQCSVLDAESDALRQSRLQFCDLTARTIQTGLELLGIGVVDKM